MATRDQKRQQKLIESDIQLLNAIIDADGDHPQKDWIQGWYTRFYEPAEGEEKYEDCLIRKIVTKQGKPGVDPRIGVVLKDGSIHPIDYQRLVQGMRQRYQPKVPKEYKPSSVMVQVFIDILKSRLPESDVQLLDPEVIRPIVKKFMEQNDLQNYLTQYSEQCGYSHVTYDEETKLWSLGDDDLSQRWVNFYYDEMY